MMPRRTIRLLSFGHRHGPPPAAHAVWDLRAHLRDPDLAPALRTMSAHDSALVCHVLATPGVASLITGVTATGRAMATGPGSPGTDVVLAVGCAGGRHRAPVVVESAYRVLAADGIAVTVDHRDLHRPVVDP